MLATLMRVSRDKAFINKQLVKSKKEKVAITFFNLINATRMLKL